MGKQFVETEGNEGANFKDISQAIERALMYVMEKRMDYGCSSVTTEMYNTSSFSPQSALDSTVIASGFNADKVLTSIKYYMDNIESQVRSSSSKIDVLTALIPQIMNEIGGLKSKLEAMEEWKVQLEHLDSRILTIETDDSINKTKVKLEVIETHLPELDSQLVTLREELGHIKYETVINFKNLEQKHQTLDVKLMVTENQVNELSKAMVTNEDNLNVVKKCLQEKSKESDKIMERLQKNEREIEKEKKETEERCERDSVIMTDVENRLRRHEEKWNDREMKNVRKMEDKLQRMDAERKKDVYFMGENLEKLLSKLDDMKTNVNNMSTKVDIVEKRQKRPVGFSAKLSLSFTTPTKKTVMRDFTDIVTNRGDHFQPLTGEFTAPIEGLYVVALMHRQWQDGEIWLVVLHASLFGGSGSKEKAVCETRTDISRTSSNSVSVIWMNAGDKLWVNVRNVKGTDIWIDAPSSFSCFLIG
ncbi:filamin A-interacting protein 1-like isoform X2 [Biomphalaria glabrata]|nr:filamin A-interacting protein 1-like isoform X2 [Biomphalaria glabrata]